MPRQKRQAAGTRLLTRGGRLLIIPILLACVTLGYVVFKGHAASANITVDFTRPLVNLDPYAFSSTISTYSTNGSGIIDSAKQRTGLGNLLGNGQYPALDHMLYRIPIRYNGGNPVSSAGGHPGGSGSDWVNNINAFGGTPMIVIGGQNGDNDFTTDDAAKLVNYFNGPDCKTSTQAGWPASGTPWTCGGPKVNYWVIGNEPNNGGMDIGTYCNLFNSTYDAMKKIRPDISGQRQIFIDGPAWADYDQGTIQSFLNCAGSRVDIVDFHNYGMGGSALDTATALSQTGNWETEVAQVRQMINASVASRSSQIGIQVGEYNWSWRTGDGWNGYNGDDRFYQAINTVWGASVAGHIAKAGGHGNQYSDQNGGLGITFQEPADAQHYGRAVNDPMPIYYGLEMFTGGKLFRHFGSEMVNAGTGLANVEVFASSNPSNIVLINKDASAAQSAVVGLTGVTSGTYDVWQTNKDAPFAEPTAKGTGLAFGNSTIPVSLPPYSVTTIIVNPGTGGTSTPSPTATPTPAQTPTVSPTPSTVPANAVQDGQGNEWWVGADGKVYENGSLAGFTSQVTNLIYTNGKIYQENSSGNWWYWDGTGWVATTNPGQAGDINNDGKVNVFDLSALLSNWGTSNANADLNHDGTVNVFDLSLLLSHWTG